MATTPLVDPCSVKRDDTVRATWFSVTVTRMISMSESCHETRVWQLPKLGSCQTPPAQQNLSKIYRAGPGFGSFGRLPSPGVAAAKLSNSGFVVTQIIYENVSHIYTYIYVCPSPQLSRSPLPGGPTSGKNNETNKS